MIENPFFVSAHISTIIMRSNSLRYYNDYLEPVEPYKDLIYDKETNNLDGNQNG